MSQERLKYEAEHAAAFHCPAETQKEFDQYVQFLREAWESFEKVESEEE
jgi:hypothetical protein